MKDRTTRRRPSARGFTLIEVMIVMAVLAILAAIALPSYREYIARSRRAQAQAQLLEAAQYMQRYYSEHDRYDQSRATPPVALTAVPAPLDKVPRDSSAQTYAIRFVSGSPTATSFAIEAERAGAMTGDRCGNFRIDHVGRRSLSGAAGSLTVADCWK